jgi:hypothetical protein
MLLIGVPRRSPFRTIKIGIFGGFHASHPNLPCCHTSGCAASAQSATAPATSAATTDAKPVGKIKLTMHKLKDTKTKWAANKPRLNSKGLTGGDRWFYIEECISKT